MKMKNLMLKLVLAMLVAPAMVYSQNFYLGDGAGGTGAGNLYQINASTCAITTIGAMGRSVTGLAADASGNLFATESTQFGSIGASNLLSINTTTGVATVIGVLTDSGAAVDHDAVPDITFRGSTLYGWSEEDDTVITIDTATGEVTDLGNGINSAGSGLAATPSGNMFVIPCGGCGFDLGNTDDSDLFSVNPATGVVTQVTDLIDNSTSGNVETSDVTIAAMTADNLGNLWAYAGGFESGTPPSSELITVNQTTGELLTVCAGLPDGIDALAFADSASPLVARAIPSLNGWFIASLSMLFIGLIGMFGYRHFG